ncbi:MAG: CBS domain-containing protein [Candidatus Nanoarchaeia archaeon]|nr:CBS domain-containing protein [Candidatus Nanoarchaeia archaeon]MDD5239682.1 CBS domain-containing protein [Candidatus Nanoarchaeia archaeon]
MGTMVKELMDDCPVTITQDISIKSAVQLLVKHKHRLLPVVNEMNYVVGAFSETDLMKLVKLQPLPTASSVWTNIPKDIAERKVSELMNSHPVTISERAEIKDALNLMNVTNVKAIMVLDMDDKLVGIIRFRRIIDKMLENL